VQLLPAAALLARVERAGTQGDALTDVGWWSRRSDQHVGQSADQPLGDSDLRAAEHCAQPRSGAKRLHLVRKAGVALNGNLFAQPAGEMIQRYLQRPPIWHSADDAGDHRAAEALA
jgi:hypothetical protein